MKKTSILILIVVALAAMLAVVLTHNEPTRQYRYIHNCDGTDMLGNPQHGHRPLTLADLNQYVDFFSNGGATTLMVCSGSDFTNYRSRYGRFFGDDLNGTLDSSADTTILRYYRNFKRLEAEGADFIRAYLERTKQNGKEAFITYRMNDLHLCDPKSVIPVHISDFWGAHPEYYVGDEGHGWHREGALNFSFPEVREQKYNMVAEQLDLYGDVLDGFELDFCRFVVYFPLGEGWANKEKITDLVRNIKAKTDSVSLAEGHKILLTARVPDTWISCQNCGLDVRKWVKEGLVDFLTLAVHWKGDPAVNADSFREEAGIGKKIPVYVTVDDGTYKPRECYTHGQMRGAASYAFAHGADGIYLFNYFYGVDVVERGAVNVRNGIVSQTICPELMPELGSAEALEGRNKTYMYYCANAEYGLSYKSTMPLHPSKGWDETVTFHIGDRMETSRPQKAYLFYLTSKDGLRVRFNGCDLSHDQDPDLPGLYCKTDNLGKNTAGCFTVPVEILKHGINDVSIATDSLSVTISKLELTLDYGDVSEHGYH